MSEYTWAFLLWKMIFFFKSLCDMQSIRFCISSVDIKLYFNGLQIIS